jgi:hypothetical protein
VSGDASAGGEITFTFGAGFNPVMRVVGADTDGVSWRCTGGVEQWADNTFWFDLADHGPGTRLRFRQEYAVELSDDDYAVCNYNWGYYLESLRVRDGQITEHWTNFDQPGILRQLGAIPA